MLKHILITGSVLFAGINLPAQQTVTKAAIDTSVLSTWPSIVGAAISHDGNYALYTRNDHNIYNQIIASAYTLVVQAMQDDWKIEVPGVFRGTFTEDSRMVIFSKPKDSLGIITLGQASVKYIPGVRSFKLFMQGNSEWLACQMTTPGKELELQHLATGKKKIYTGVISYLLSKDGTTLALQKEKAKDGDGTQIVSWVNLTTGKEHLLWEGKQAGSLFFDKEGRQLAFIVEDKTADKPTKAIWYYKIGMEKAVMLADTNSTGLDKGLQIDNIHFQGFSRDGRRLFISLKEPERPKPPPGAVQVNIWSYTDAKLQSMQLKELDAPKTYIGVIDIGNKQITRLQQKNETISILESKSGTIAYVTKLKGDRNERNWSEAARAEYYLVFIEDGKRIKLQYEMEAFFGLSSGGKYLLCTDPKQFYSYELSTGITRIITKNLPVPLTDPDYDSPGPQYRGLSFATWLGDSAVLIYDKYDVWQLDPAGIKSPVSITNGYGRRHHIIFRLAGEDRGKVIPENKILLLSAFNQDTKDNGFYKKLLSRPGDPERLTMGPWYYHHPHPGMPSGYPIKARDVERYLVTRQNSNECPNYFYTSDFKTFYPLSHVYPERDYNWLSTELITYKTLDGRSVQGVLYKPENFDSNKRYPVILHYYERKSYLLHVYPSLGWITHDINIPLFVSNGYLVFTPDIDYIIGEPGQSVVNSVVGAAKYLSMFPWVDAGRMGIQGHSFGGYETNYLVTHTDIFAAAMSSAGPSNFISGYGSILRSGGSKQFFYEVHQSRIGHMLWEKVDSYIKNSPVLYTDKVTTPLLMMNNKEDGAVSFEQGVEFFTGLRRLGKIAWMLQYDGEGHGVIGEDASKDYTIRMIQFFDHYLKGKPAPKWMTRGIPASVKGVDNGFELDNEIRTPGPGLLIPSEQEKVNSLLKTHRDN